MTYQEINDHTQLRPGDLLEYRCPRFGIVTQWRVEGIHLGGLNTESVVHVTSITRRPSATAPSPMLIPEQMIRHLPIIRAPEAL